MAIVTHLTYDEALALPGQKSIWLDGGRCVVDTAPDTSLPLVRNNKVNVRTFKAKGDGITDDTDAIQRASDYAIEKGYALYFPAGIYLITRSITINGKWIIQGEGSLSRIKINDPTIPLLLLDINVNTVLHAYIGKIHLIGPNTTDANSCAIKFIGDNTSYIQNCTFENIWCTDFNAFVKDEKAPRTTSHGLEAMLNWNTWSRIHLFNVSNYGFWHTKGSGTGNTWDHVKSMLRRPNAATWCFEGDGCVVGDVIIDGAHLGGRDAITGCTGVKVGPNIKYKSRCSITNSQFDANCNNLFDISGTGGDEANNWKVANNNIGGNAVLNTPYMSQSIIEDKDVDYRQTGRRIKTSSTGALVIDCFDVGVAAFGGSLITVTANGLIGGVAVAASEFKFHVSSNGTIVTITEIERMVTHANQFVWSCVSVDANTARIKLNFTPTSTGSDISVVATSRGHKHKLVRV